MADKRDWKTEIELLLRSNVPGYNPWAQKEDSWLDHRAALDAINFFATRLKHVEGAARGEPFILRKWQGAIVGNLFGWKRKDDAGRIVRRYRKSLIFVPRGNGKSPLAAGIILYAFFEDHEPGAQCFLAAGSRGQAGIMFRNCRGMVEQDAALLGRCKIYGGDQHRSLILLDDPLSFCKVIPADAAGQHGGIPHAAVIDELHVQESRDLVDVFETAMSKRTRAQPLLVFITTADFERPSVCNEIHDFAEQVRDNPGDKKMPGYAPDFLPVIYEAGRNDDWRDEKVWERANPNIDVSVSRESLAKSARKAQENPAFENAFRRLHMNQRTGQENRIINMDLWNACRGDLDVKALIASLKGKPCVAGFDLASTEDLASFTLIFPGVIAAKAESLAVLSWSFCPESRIQKRARMKVPYDQWAKEGLLIATPGDMIDYQAIEDQFGEVYGMFDVRGAGVDPASGGKPFAGKLNENYGAEFAHIVPQTFDNLSGPFKELLRRLKKKIIVHGGNPLLTWQAGNLAAHFKGKIPQGADLSDHLDKVPIIPSKQASADKIDGMAAWIIALARLLAKPIAAADDGPTIMVI